MAKNFYEAKMGARSVKFYALSLKQIQDHEDSFEEAAKKVEGEGGLSRERFLRYLPAFILSAKRGDENVTADDVAAVVDMQNFNNVMRAAFGMADKIVDTETQSDVPTSPLTGGDSTHV